MEKDVNAEDAEVLLGRCGAFFMAMGDEVRQKLFISMAEAGGAGMNVSTLTSLTRLSRPAVSHHLKVLKESGLIESYREGAKNYYYVDLRKKLGEVKDFIVAVEKLLAEKNCPGK